jgi:hypothetical protein
VLTGADNTNAGTDSVVVTVLEASGSVQDVNLVGHKVGFLFMGFCMFNDLGIVDDYSSGFSLEFSYNGLRVVSNIFTVHPHRLLFVHQPSVPLFYISGQSHASLSDALSVLAVDGQGRTLVNCDSADDSITISLLELGGIAPAISGTAVRQFSGGVASFPGLQIFKDCGTHFYLVVQSSSQLLRAGMDFFASRHACCSAFTQQFSIRPFSYVITSAPTVLRYPDDSVFVSTSVRVSLTDGISASLENAGKLTCAFWSFAADFHSHYCR